MKGKFIILCCLSIIYSCNSQINLEEYLGGWSGQFEEENWFKYEILLSQKGEEYSVDFIGTNSTTTLNLQSNGIYFEGAINEHSEISLMMDDDQPILFIRIGHHQCHVHLYREKDVWKGDWSLLIYEDFKPTLYLSLHKEQEHYSASTFFKEPSLHFMWSIDFRHHDDQLEFIDERSSLQFKGTLKNDKIFLNLTFLNETRILAMERLDYPNWKRGTFEPVLKKNFQNSKQFQNLITDIENDTLERTHCIIISKSDSIGLPNIHLMDLSLAPSTIPDPLLKA